MDTNGKVSMNGSIGMRKGTNLGSLASYQTPGLLSKLKNFFINTTLATDMRGMLGGSMSLRSALSGRAYRIDPLLPLEQLAKVKEMLTLNIDVRELTAHFGGQVTEFGALSYRVVTDAGVAFLANNFAGSGAAISTMKYHGFGTGTGVEAAADTTLGTELTTQYVVDNTRPTGSQSSAAGVYTTVGTLAPDSGGTIAITEHGLFSATSSGTLWDRSKFSAINLVAGSDSLQVTYALTLTSGG